MGVCIGVVGPFRRQRFHQLNLIWNIHLYVFVHNVILYTKKHCRRITCGDHGNLIMKITTVNVVVFLCLYRTFRPSRTSSGVPHTTGTFHSWMKGEASCLLVLYQFRRSIMKACSRRLDCGVQRAKSESGKKLGGREGRGRNPHSHPVRNHLAVFPARIPLRHPNNLYTWNRLDSQSLVTFLGDYADQ